MAGFSNAVENSVLDLVLRGVAWALPAGGYISLHSMDPGETGVNELVNVADATYARQPAVWNPAALGVSSLSALVDFGNLPPGPIAYFGVWTAAVGGSFLGGGPCTPATPQLHDGYRLEAGATFSLD